MRKKTKYNPKNETRPEIWYQEGHGEKSYSTNFGPRLRILYPDGRESEWVRMSGETTECCWDLMGCGPWVALESIKLKRKAMRYYDKVEGFPKAVFVGYA